MLNDKSCCSGLTSEQLGTMEYVTWNLHSNNNYHNEMKAIM